NVDVMPMDVQLAFAYGLRWSPRPVFQSYAAVRPYLDERDALHLSGPNAPRFVLFNAADIDMRYPLFDEPKTYRTLLAQYRVRLVLPDWLLFEKRDGVVPMQETTVANATGQLGEWIDVPAHAGSPIYGRVELRSSPVGLAMTLIDRPPELHIRFQYGGGQLSPWYRFVPAVAPDGLLLSSYAPDTASVARLAQGQIDQ